MSMEMDIAATGDVALGAAPAPIREAASGEAEKPVVRFGPARGWELLNVRELWAFRELVFFLTWRDVKVRYKQTALGAAWAILQPAMMMVILTIVFGRMAKVETDVKPYHLFVYAGLLPWTFFATAIAQAGNSVVGSERLITKIYFPRLAIPLASVGAAIVDFVIASCLMVGMMLWYQRVPGMQILAAPVIFAVIVMTALGVGTLLAALAVSYRDFKYVIPFMVQLWLFGTPSIYMQAGTEGTGLVQRAMQLNPMTALIGGFRSALLGGQIEWMQVGMAAGVGLALFLAGCFYFRRMESTFADVI